MIEIDTVERERKWCWIFSLLMLLFPIFVVFTTIVSRFCFESKWYGPFLPFAAKLWIATGVVGLFAGVRASHLVRWSGSDLLLIVVHLLSLFLVTALCVFAGTPNVGYLSPNNALEPTAVCAFTFMSTDNITSPSSATPHSTAVAQLGR
jgi:hypothetical protein